MEGEKPINSHIQLPLSVLRGFSTKETIYNANNMPEKREVIYAMDFDGMIVKKDIKEVNTKTGYYSAQIEERLSEIETKFGDIKHKIRKLYREGEKANLTLNNKDVETVAKYCTLCLIRSEELHNRIRAKHKVLNPQDLAIKCYFDRQQELDKLISCDNITFVYLPQEDAALLLPQCGFAKFICDTGVFVWVPIASDLAIVLTDRKTITEDGVFHIGHIEDGQVDAINIQMIEAEKACGKKVVYAKREKDLLRYRKYMMSHKREA